MGLQAQVWWAGTTQSPTLVSGHLGVCNRVCGCAAACRAGPAVAAAGGVQHLQLSLPLHQGGSHQVSEVCMVWRDS